MRGRCRVDRAAIQRRRGESHESPAGWKKPAPSLALSAGALHPRTPAFSLIGNTKTCRSQALIDPSRRRGALCWRDQPRRRRGVTEVTFKSDTSDTSDTVFLCPAGAERFFRSAEGFTSGQIGHIGHCFSAVRKPRADRPQTPAAWAERHVHVGGWAATLEPQVFQTTYSFESRRNRRVVTRWSGLLPGRPWRRAGDHPWPRSTHHH